MSMYEHQLLSKILDEKNFFITKKFNIQSEDFVVLPKVYGFVEKYVKENKGAIPDYRTVGEQVQTSFWMIRISFRQWTTR